VSDEKLVLPHVKKIRARIRLETAKRFHPDVVDAFERVARREQFWLDASSRSILTVMRHRIHMDDIVLDTAGLLQFAEFFRRLIDFRSPFTASHSSGVAATAEALARLSGFTDDDVQRMRVASYLHDLGKLAVPREIIEKPTRLTPEEHAIMEGHVYYTYRILEPITDLRTIREWSAFHQERMDGSGYPFHLKGEDLSMGARILAVADVFTAITENRPYREGMDGNQALHVLDAMVERNELDPELVDLTRTHVDELNATRCAAQSGSHDEYQRFLSAIAL
jgi:HD-GYP domain-containing protein (c-di-GMP phosphodiesterase class II)